MKNKKLLLIPITLMTLMGCSAVKGLENEVTVVFEYDGEVIKTDTVHQFKNCLTPSLSEEQIPIDNEFFGWTWFNPDSIKATDENFDSKYIENNGVVHYDEIKSYTQNSVVVLRPLFIDIAEIPVPNYYIAIGWYGKTSTSGLDKAKMDAWTDDLKSYLQSEGATSEDLDNIIVKEYLGDVATAGGLVNKDRFIDVLVGFGNNIKSTGGVDVIEKVGGIEMGGKSRVIARLTEKEIAIKVYNWLQTDDGNKALK